MSATPVERDERTLAVENASYRWSYHALSFGVLGIVAFRAFARGESAWDLLALVVLGGVMNAAYQGAHRALSGRWMRLAFAALALATVLAVGIVLFRGGR